MCLALQGLLLTSSLSTVALRALLRSQSDRLRKVEHKVENQTCWLDSFQTIYTDSRWLKWGKSGAARSVTVAAQAPSKSTLTQEWNRVGPLPTVEREVLRKCTAWQLHCWRGAPRDAAGRRGTAAGWRNEGCGTRIVWRSSTANGRRCASGAPTARCGAHSDAILTVRKEASISQHSNPAGVRLFPVTNGGQLTWERPGEFRLRKLGGSSFGKGNP